MLLKFKIVILAASLGSLAFATSVHAMSFWLVNDDYTCNNDHILIEDSYGDYVLAEWYSGRIGEGRQVFSDDSIRSYGFKDIRDSSGSSMKIWVDDYDMSASDANAWCYDS